MAAGYRERAGRLPPIELSSFWLTITANLNWTYNQFCAALDAVGDEKRAFAEAELQHLIADPLALTKIERLLDDLRPVTS